MPVSFQLTTFWVQKNPWSEPGIDMFVATVFSWIPNSYRLPVSPSCSAPADGSTTPVPPTWVALGGALNVTCPRRSETLYEYGVAPSPIVGETERCRLGHVRGKDRLSYRTGGVFEQVQIRQRRQRVERGALMGQRTHPWDSAEAGRETREQRREAARPSGGPGPSELGDVDGPRRPSEVGGPPAEPSARTTACPLMAAGAIQLPPGRTMSPATTIAIDSSPTFLRADPGCVIVLSEARWRRQKYIIPSSGGSTTRSGHRTLGVRTPDTVHGASAVGRVWRVDSNTVTGSVIASGREPADMATVQVGGVTLYWSEQGSGPTVVFVHGIPTDHRAWDAQTSALSGKFRTLSYSRRYAHPNPRVGDLSDSTVENNATDLAGFICPDWTGSGAPRRSLVRQDSSQPTWRRDGPSSSAR